MHVHIFCNSVPGFFLYTSALILQNIVLLESGITEKAFYSSIFCRFFDEHVVCSIMYFVCILLCVLH